MIEHYSAALLIKMSAKQLLYFKIKNKKPEVSKQQIEGEKHQENKAKELKAANELRGQYIKDNICINFSNDLFKDNIFYEVKYVKDINNYENWYLENSLLQTAFYFALLKFQIFQYRHRINEIDYKFLHKLHIHE